MDTKSVFKIPFGLFVLTAKDGDKDNGCIINTAMQLTSKPQRISITVNKANYTHDMIMKTGLFNVSVLTESTPFGIFEHFGFQSGKDADKFAQGEGERSSNGLMYVPWNTNALMSGKVIETVDCGTHTLFVADVTEAKVLSDAPSVTYDYYQKNIKPRPEPAKKKGWVCKICGYVYEGDPLPADFICPICKHPAEDFELVK
ncbi:MAG: flavin reductase [Clostridiales bacterium]|nr:flavin reductase [Clostridiales bacterium]